MRLLGLLLAMVSLGLTVPARARGEVGFRELEAKKACLTGNAEKGLEILADLYVATDDPTHLFNQGRCLQQSERHGDAVGKFREYLRKVGRGDAKGRAAAERHIEECQSLLGERLDGGRAAAEATENWQRERGVEAASGEVRREGEGDLPRQPAVQGAISAPPPSPTAPTADEGRPGGALRLGGILSVGLGLVTVGTGVALNVGANELTAEVNRLYDRDKDERRRTYETLAWSCYALGVAAVGAGVVMYYAGWRAERATYVAIAPHLGRGATGFMVQGVF